MKNIYEIFNEIDIDEAEMTEIEVTELEKARLKNSLKASIKNNKKNFRKIGLTAAAIICIFAGSIGFFGVTFPTYAAETPIIGDIFRFFDNGKTGIYDKFKENANELNITKEDNGISMTIVDALFDGKNIYLSYEIKSDKDLGIHPSIINDNYHFLDIKGYKGGLSSNYLITKINSDTNDNVYIGKSTYTIDADKLKEITCKLRFNEISFSESEDDIIKGNWNFDFNLKAIENNKQIINKVFEQDDIKFSIDSITKTPVSFILNYSQYNLENFRKNWFDVTLGIADVKDDLGNVYTRGDGGEGHGDDNHTEWTAIFEKLNENATKLIITPKVHFSNNGGGISYDPNGNETKISPAQVEGQPKSKDVILDAITIDLKK
jgi:hypothetical protein